MADYYYGIDKGDSTYEAVGQTTDMSKTVVVRVDVAPGVERSDVLVSLEKLKDFILRAPWPPVTPS